MLCKVVSGVCIDWSLESFQLVTGLWVKGTCREVLSSQTDGYGCKRALIELKSVFCE